MKIEIKKSIKPVKFDLAIKLLEERLLDRNSDKKNEFVGPRFMIRLASLEMHPLDKADRIENIKNDYGSGMCNITRCCTDVCPEHIQITDNGIIPLKERVVDRYYDPIIWLWNKLFGKPN